MAQCLNVLLYFWTTNKQKLCTFSCVHVFYSLFTDEAVPYSYSTKSWNTETFPLHYRKERFAYSFIFTLTKCAVCGPPCKMTCWDLLCFTLTLPSPTRCSLSGRSDWLMQVDDRNIKQACVRDFSTNCLCVPSTVTMSVGHLVLICCILSCSFSDKAMNVKCFRSYDGVTVYTFG